jgi:pterin-4a-carbinolamine dehydratase
MRARTKPATTRGTAGRRTSSRRPGRPGGKLKPERVQEELKAMPGWRLTAGGNALGRTRKFSQPGAAAQFAADVADLAAGQKQPAILGVTAHQVTLTLQRPSRNGIDMALINFARQLDDEA